MMNVNVCLFVKDKFNQIFTHLFFFLLFYLSIDVGTCSAFNL